jgi:hypothetical protein
MVWNMCQIKGGGTWLVILTIICRHGSTKQLTIYNNKKQKTCKTRTKCKMTKNITNLVFARVFSFLGLKLASMQVLFHSWQPLPNFFCQVMHF